MIFPWGVSNNSTDSISADHPLQRSNLADAMEVLATRIDEVTMSVSNLGEVEDEVIDLISQITKILPKANTHEAKSEE